VYARKRPFALGITDDDPAVTCLPF